MNLPNRRRLKKRWTLEDISWERFDRTRVNLDILKMVKAAALVEANAASYGVYLRAVFAGDQRFGAQADVWAAEEIRHGRALAQWARLADSSFDFDVAFTAFRETIRVDENAAESIRGSKSGELIARCMVEVGTSSYYSALGDATDEPVLKEICARIAADEIRHYKFFLTHFRRYQRIEGLGFWRRLRIAVGRIGETEDDELSYAYYVANMKNGTYDRRTCTRAYMSRAFGFYKARHFERGTAMIFNVLGLPLGRSINRWVCRAAGRVGYFVVSRRAQRLANAGA